MKYPILLDIIKFCVDNNVDIPGDLVHDLVSIGALKTYDYYLGKLQSLVKTLYSGAIGGEFIPIMDNLVRGQIANAYETAWVDSGFELPPQDYIKSAFEAMYQDQRSYIDGFYKDIVDAKIDQTPIEPLLSRAELWANQWNTAYNDGLRLVSVEMGGKLVWRLGATEEHCSTCATLNGIVAFASEWDQSGVKPQNAPNGLLECGGWRCDCSLEGTDKRRSPNALARILDAATSANL
jgi:hypothetical protein